MENSPIRFHNRRHVSQRVGAGAIGIETRIIPWVPIIRRELRKFNAWFNNVEKCDPCEREMHRRNGQTGGRNTGTHCSFIKIAALLQLWPNSWPVFNFGWRTTRAINGYDIYVYIFRVSRIRARESSNFRRNFFVLHTGYARNALSLSW